MLSLFWFTVSAMRKLARAGIRRQRLDRLVGEIRAPQGRMGRDVYAIGVRLGRIRDGELWRARAGCQHFDDLSRQELGLSRSAAYRFMRVAEHFNREIANRYGVEKLDALIAYMRATAIDEQPGDLFAARVEVRQPDGTFRSLTLHQANASQIRDATRWLVASRRGRSAPKKVQRRLAELERRLPKAPTGTKRGRRVRVRKGRDGRLAVSFSAVPLDELADFARLLSEFARQR